MRCLMKHQVGSKKSCASCQRRLALIPALLLALFSICSMQPAHGQSSLTNGLVAHYPFDGNANDASSNGNHGIVSGALPDLDRYGFPNSSFKFTGTTNQIRLNLGAIYFTSDFSISVWVKFDDFIAGYPTIVDADTGFVRFSALGSSYLPTDRQKLGFYQYQPSNGRQFGSLTSSTVLATNQWYHLTLVRSGLTFRMYVNATLASQTNESGSVSLFGSYLQVGNDLAFNDGQHFLHGNMDDLRIYNRALAQPELAQLGDRCTPVPPNQTAWWPGEGNANDIHGTNDGVLVNGTTFAVGAAGEAFSFDGTNDYVVVPDSEAQRSTNLTIEGWFNFPRAPVAGGGPADEFILAAKYTNSAGWNLRVSSSLLPSFRLYALPSSSASAQSSVSVSLNSWVHLAGTYDGTTARIYVNGVLQGTAPLNGGYTASTVPMTLGTASWFAGGFTAGLVDELATYSRALSDTEIQAIYSAGKCKVPSVMIQPTNQGVFPGANAEFAILAIGRPPVTYQWFFNQTNLLVGRTNAFLTLTNIVPSQAGTYSVLVSDTIGSVMSSNAILTVLIPGGDADSDGLLNEIETQLGTNPTLPDTDADGRSDFEEVFTWGTNPLKLDTDGDGMPDGWEILHGLNPRFNDAADDLDGDGLSNLTEYNWSLSHPNQVIDPRTKYSISATASDYALVNGVGTNQFFYDRNNRLIGAEFDRGLALAYVYDGNDNLVRQVSMKHDANTNGLPDVWEFLNGLTNNASAYTDTDGDGWSDWQEWKSGTQPTNTASAPNLLGNPGTQIASLQLSFTPSNFVVGVGQLDGSGAEEIILGADGNPGTNVNWLLVLTQTSSGWSTQRVDVGVFGVTSIAVGQLTNRPSAGIYVGLRGPTNGSGRVMEFTGNGGLWQSNLVARSTNQAAFVLGVRGPDVLVSLATTNAPDGSLSAVNFTTNWSLFLMDTNASHRGLGIVANLRTNQTSLRLLDSGGIQTGHAMPLPTNSVYRAASGSWFFVTPVAMTWSNAESFAQTYGGHLASIADASENEFVRSIAGDAWIGLNDAAVEGTFVWSSGEPLTFANWNPGEPNNGLGAGEEDGVLVDGGSGKWWDTTASSLLSGVIETSHGVPASVKLLPEPSATRTNNWRGLNLASGVIRTATNEAYSVFYSFADHKNANGLIDFADDFVTAEYLVSGTNATLLTLSRQPIAALSPVQSYGLAAVNFLNTSNEVFFTGEPDGQVFAWTATGATNPLQRQSFSGHHAGKAWHALAGVKTLDAGEALIGLRVDPAAPNQCDVIFWSPQAQLPPLVNLPNTPPAAAVLPSAGTLGGQAAVTVRLWDAEGNASTPFLQYQISGTTNWQAAALMLLNGVPYSVTNRVTTSPAGTSYTVVWDALTDLGANVVTNLSLRARALDTTSLGDWSVGTPFQVDTSQADNDGMDDSWEQQYFGNTTRSGAGDFDGDGFTDFQEFIADTNPTNAASHLRMTGALPMPSGLWIQWQGGVQATQYLQRLSDLHTNFWQSIATSLPPTPISGSYTDAPGTNAIQFYRIKATR